ncbi:hypothetical protein [Dactylosporangium sp. CA-139066]|uniref:hypothetical protein n=1 Tax=Dactylosporangium sp. CA-139066 TaxID=3239930 RepID=UPI003D8D4151
MKGKHGRAAETRQQWLDLERDRDGAMDRAMKLQAQLTADRDAWARRQAAMESEIAALRTAASEAVTPVVQQLRDQIERMRAQRDEAVALAEKARAKQGRMAERTVGFIAKALGITHVEAMEYVGGFIDLGAPRDAETGDVLLQTVLDNGLNERIDRGELTYEQAVQIDGIRYGRKRKRHRALDEAFDATVNQPTGALGPLTSDVAAAVDAR